VPFKQKLYRLSPVGYLALERAYRASPIGRSRMRAALAHMERTIARRSEHEAQLYRDCIGSSLAVLDGPFAGMRYNADAAGSVLGPKLIGSYEREVVPWIEAAVAAGYRRILDIGCAEGYYAVGFALRLPEAEILGFDLDLAALDMCRKHARLNGVEGRVKLEARCTHERMQELLATRALIFCDIEGAERELLDPVLAPALRGADIIVETHDFRSPGITAELVERFRTTHGIEIVAATRRNVADYAQLARFPEVARAGLIDEVRSSGQCWMRLVARQSGARRSPWGRA
jgi:predicted O-methyltransferase YrrM